MQHDVTIVSTDCCLPGTERWLLEKDGGATPPAGTRVNYFKRSLLEPNLARLMMGLEGIIICLLFPKPGAAEGFPRA